MYICMGGEYVFQHQIDRTQFMMYSTIVLDAGTFYEEKYQRLVYLLLALQLLPLSLRSVFSFFLPRLSLKPAAPLSLLHSSLFLS